MRSVAVCIPVRDEATELPNLFTALDRLEAGRGDEIHVCLFLDGCIDESAALATSYRDKSTFQVSIASVGRSRSNAGGARHRAMMMGLDALSHGSGLLLTTDADSTPTPRWLRVMSAGLAKADIVTGRVARTERRPNRLQDRIEAYYDSLFALRRTLDPVVWEARMTHHYTSGANMGMRPSVYTEVGGFEPVASGEDAKFIDDAGRAGFSVRRDADSMVCTSDRRVGRVSDGLAGTLRRLDGADADVVKVAHPVDSAWQYRMHSQARTAFDDDRLAIFAAAIGISHDHVRGVARDCLNAEAFAMQVVPVPPSGMRSIALPDAEAELAAIIGAREAA